MVIEEQLKQLKSYSTASWAIWTETVSDCNDNFFYNNISLLKDNIILLGINPSRNISAFDNFHKPDCTGVRNLTRIFQGESLSNLKGSYMTDLDVVIQPNSTKVKVNLNQAREALEKQINILANKVSLILCFGGKAYITMKRMYSPPTTRILDNNIKYFSFLFYGNKIEVYGCYHYASRGYNKEQANVKLKEQLQYINDLKK